MQWLTVSPEQLLGIALSTLVLYIILMIVIRLNGLRSFSKMSAHDFGVTIAVGSMLGATVIQKEPSILQGGFAIGCFLGLQSLYSLYRLKRKKPHLENEPILLMQGSEILYDNLKSAKITKDDLIAKLREANVLQLSEVQAVVLESTGDVSVLHGDAKLDDVMLESVKSTP